MFTLRIVKDEPGQHSILHICVLILFLEGWSKHETTLAYKTAADFTINGNVGDMISADHTK